MLMALLVVAVQAFQPVPTPEQAAGSALMQCVAHAAGMGSISATSANALKANGLEFSAAPPPHLRSMTRTPYGVGSFAQARSSEGNIWAVGYDGGACIVMALGTAPEPVEQRLAAMFAIPNTWKPEAINQTDASSRWTQYGWTANGRRVTAQMKVTPLPASPVKGMVMVTIAPAPAPDNKKK